MWRIFNGIPRAIRKNRNGPRAAAGICKDDDHCQCRVNNESIEASESCRNYQDNCVDCGQTCSGYEWSECTSDGGSDAHKEKHDWWTPPHSNFWSMFNGSHKTLEAVTWGAAVVLGIQLSHPTLKAAGCLPDDAQPGSLKSSLLYQVAFALPSFQTKKNVLVSSTPIKNEAQTSDVSEDDDPVSKVMMDFKNVCSKYTAIGKNIIGLTKAREGNMKGAVPYLEQSSELGHSGAQYNMGVCFEQGQGVSTSLAQAAKFYSKAAASEHPEALYNLAMLYLKGDGGVCKDTKRALKLLERAAQQGLTQAQTYLGVYYTEEEKEDMEKAVSFFIMAAEKNDAEAQYFLGICYEQGWGVEMNECKAANCYNAASQNGHDGAMYNLGIFHEFGLGGLPKDRVSALDLFSRSAGLGNESAAFKLQEWNANAALLEWSVKFGMYQDQQNPDNSPAVNTVTKPRQPEQVTSGVSPSASSPSLTAQVKYPPSDRQPPPPVSPSASTPSLTDLVKLNLDQLRIGQQIFTGYTQATDNSMLGKFLIKADMSETKAFFFLEDEPDNTTCREKTITKRLLHETSETCQVKTSTRRRLFDMSESNLHTTGLKRSPTMPGMWSVVCP